MIVALVASVPLLYLAIVWSSVPAIIPIHFDLNMKPNRTAGKSELWIPTLILAACSLLVYVVMRNINKIDPKRVSAAPPSSAFTRLSLVVVVFISVLNLLLVMTCTSNGHMPVALFMPVMGLLFACIGNYLPALKPNYFAGIRLPWTLSSESNWKKTHQLAGKLWFWGGLCFAFISLFLPTAAGVPVLLATIIIMSVIPGVYSYRLFAKEKNTPS